MAPLLVLLGFGIMAMIQVPPMFQKKWWRDLKVYGFIYLLSFYTAMSYALDLPILSPVKFITLVMTTIYRYLGYEIPPQ